VAIPLETFVHSARNVLGTALALSLRWTDFMLRLGGIGAQAFGELLVNVYDMVIFLPLWMERHLRARQRAAGTGKSSPSSGKAPAVAEIDPFTDEAMSGTTGEAAQDSVEEEVLS